MEDYFIVKRIIQQGLKGGYMKDSINPEAIDELDTANGSWILKNGYNIGSTWDIILNPEFAKILWGEVYQDHLVKMVVMPISDRVSYLSQFMVEETETPELEEQEFVEPPADALMMAIREGYSSLKDISIGLYKDSCKRCYQYVFEIAAKKSVAEVNGNDFVILNAMDRSTEGAIAKFLSENGKASFTVCPECSQYEFNHAEGCSIDKLTTAWSVAQNDGC